MRLYEFITEAGSPALSPDLIKKIKSLYDDGMTAVNIGKEVGKTSSNINAILSRYYADRTPRQSSPPTPETIDQIKQLYNQGLTYAEIADRIGNLSVRTVNNILSRYYSDRPASSNSRNIPVPTSEVDKVKQLYDHGDSLEDIGNAIGKSAVYVQRILFNYHGDRVKRVTGATGPKGIDSDQKNKMAQLYADGHTLEFIAKTFAISTPAAFYHIKNMPNISDIRSQHAANIDMYKDNNNNKMVTTPIHRAGKPNTLTRQQ